MAQRDDFTAATKRLLADRVGHRCSNPACRASTCGPQADPWVAIGARNFLDENDPAFAATYVDALEELVAKRLVRREAGILYSLTGAGFRIARRLKDFMIGNEG